REGSLLQLDGRLPLELAPSYNSSANGSGHRPDHDVVHHLPVTEPLQKQPPEQLPPLSLFKRKRECCGHPIYRQEECIIEEHLLQIPERVLVRMRHPVKNRREYRPDQSQVHDRREQRKDDLKNPIVRKSDPSQRSITRSEQRVTMLPQTLQCSIGPSKPL